MYEKHFSVYGRLPPNVFHVLADEAQLGVLLGPTDVVTFTVNFFWKEKTLSQNINIYLYIFFSYKESHIWPSYFEMNSVSKNCLVWYLIQVWPCFMSMWDFPSFNASCNLTFIFTAFALKSLSCSFNQRLPSCLPHFPVLSSLCFRSVVWSMLSCRLMLRQLFWQQTCGALQHGENER